MIDPELYIKEGLKIIDALLKQGNLTSALSGCQELFKVNPYHRKLQKYLKKIEERILKQNEEKVEADIAGTLHLWKEERYNDLIKIYTKLYQYAPGYSRLQKLIQKLNEKLSEKERDERNDYVKRALFAMKQLYSEEKFADTIQACNELLTIDPLNRDVAEYLRKAKDNIIQEKLRDNERITEGADLERIVEFYESLLAIDPEHPTVKHLTLQVKAELAERKLLEAKIRLNESIVRMKDLFSKAAYEKVVQACEEIGRLDPGNLTAKIFRKKAERTIHIEIAHQMVQKLKDAWNALAPEYANNPGMFVKV